MKTKNIAIIILAALLAVASVLAAMWYPAGNDEDTTEASGQPDEIMKYRMANELLISNAKAHYTYEGTKLDDFTITAIPSGEQALFSSILDAQLPGMHQRRTGKYRAVCQKDWRRQSHNYTRGRQQHPRDSGVHERP